MDDPDNGTNLVSQDPGNPLRKAVKRVERTSANDRELAEEAQVLRRMGIHQIVLRAHVGIIGKGNRARQRLRGRRASSST